MSKQSNWQATLTIQGDQQTIDELKLQEIKTAVEATLADDSLDIALTPGGTGKSARGVDNYNAAAHLVQLITSDFEGSLYPFAMALGVKVQKYLKDANVSDSRLAILDTEMHQLITEVARTYARTGKWQ